MNPAAIGLPLVSSRSIVPASTMLTPEAHETLEERAAILEFEAGLSREEAEKEALLEWAGRKSRRFTTKDKSERKKKF